MASFLEGFGGHAPSGGDQQSLGLLKLSSNTTTSSHSNNTKHKRFRADQVIRKKTLGCGTILSQLVKLPHDTEKNEWIGKYKNKRAR